MKNKFIRSLAAVMLAASLAPLSSCVGELEQSPTFLANTETVYRDPAQIQQVLTRLYATLAISGQQGPAGLPDITGIDEGFSNYLRQYWKAQELTTDEAIIAWNDGNLPDYNRLTWNANNEFVRAMYDRIFYQVGLCNEFIRQTTDAKLSERGISGNDAATIKTYRAEARFLRALSYYHALDMFGGNVPFATEESSVGSTLPTQTNGAALFNYIEAELKAAEADLPNAGPNAATYGRATKAAAWTLLAKLYLNSKTYLGASSQDRWSDVIANCNKVIAANYQLAPEYRLLFLADNDRTAANREIIFPINFDGVRTKTFGGMTFLVHAAIGGSMRAADFGVNGGWFGLRTKKNLVDLFPDANGTADKRAMFYTAGQNKEISDIFTFTDGYAVTKYKNVTSTGQAGSDATGDFPDTDFPMFRLADVYLMYAEAVLRGGTGGSQADAVRYVNQLRTRAQAAQVTTLSLDEILNERARELYWEGHRRTDLIRFGRFTGGNYVWPFKGGTPEGRGVSDNLRIFPIPTTDLTANPNLKQNPGY
ncbi:RagB/SusD family nutrient uptake outer membrane protein [Hymenobacter oligotrophus]|uniref:RagB/SusD family nutrient uptake outer membrane protein n=1 Tax=Hymenobacter oligotrophus TaxID=2319843 RepID=A0A3B7RB83_9BACT|nr:RagB/SusD family nutrient uptake outer membrane protein [Hymenobacter oligotrophus]AYA36766.1 RagB/SusD family nutrient uptake outer membrane protein [Hymenobacter oligotrophus]